MESAGDIEDCLLNLFAYLLVDPTRSFPELPTPRPSGAQFEACAAKEQRIALQCGGAEPPPQIYRIIDPFRRLLFSEHSQQSPVQRDGQQDMNRDAFSLAALF